jgi:hypothetical protein
MNARKVKKTLRAWWRRQKKKLAQLRYELRLKAFARSNNFKNNARDHFRRHSTRYLTVMYFGVAFGISILAQNFFFNFDNKTLFGFYTSAGAMTGGMLALIFTFITLLVNYALSEYPPQFFKISGYDKRQDAVYFLLAFCSITFFIIGFSYSGDLKQNVLLNVISVLLLFFVFYLVFMSYVTVRRRLNPMYSFSRYIVRPALKLLVEADKKASKVSKLFANNPKVKAKNKDLYARQQAQILLREHYVALDNYIGVLYDYHDMLIEKKQYSAALRVLDGISNIIIEYIHVRRNNLILLPTQYLMVLETDAQTFFGNNFERLIAKVSQYIDVNNVEGIRHSINLFNILGQELASLEFSNTRNENPPFEQCIGYLNQIRDVAIQKRNVEACFKLAEVYGGIGSLSVQKKFYHGQSYALDSLLKLYVYSVATNQEVVGTRVVWSFGMMSNNFMQRVGIIYHTDFKLFVDKYKELLKYHLASKALTDDLKANVTEELLLPLRNLRALSFMLVKQGSNTRNADRLQNQREVLEVIDLVRSVARSVSEIDKTTVMDRYFYLRLMNILEILACELIDISQRHHWQSNHAEILSKLNWVVNQFGFGLRSVDKEIKHTYISDLSDMVARIGVFALSKDLTETADLSIKLIRNLADAYLKSGMDDKDYESPRIMVKVYLIGVLALHLKKEPLLSSTKTSINSFKDSYAAMFFPDGLKLARNVHYIGAYPEQIYSEIAQMVNDENDMTVVGGETPLQYAKRMFPDINMDEFIAVKKYYKLR